MSERRAWGDLTATVLRTVWTADGPLTPGEVRDRLGSDIAYTTVLTVLTRLWERGLLDREREGKGHRYRPTMSEAEFTAGEMERRLRGASDHEAVLSRFVESLSKGEMATLRRLLRRSEGRAP